MRYPVKSSKGLTICSSNIVLKLVPLLCCSLGCSCDVSQQHERRGSIINPVVNRLEAFHLLLRQTSFIQKDHQTSSTILQRKVGSKSRSSSHVTKELAALLWLFFRRFHCFFLNSTDFPTQNDWMNLPILVLHVIALFGSECTFKDLFFTGWQVRFQPTGLKMTQILYDCLLVLGTRVSLICLKD